MWGTNIAAPQGAQPSESIRYIYIFSLRTHTHTHLQSNTHTQHVVLRGLTNPHLLHSASECFSIT